MNSFSLGSAHPFQSIPFFSSYLMGHREVDWMHKTTAQKDSSFAQNYQVRIAVA